MARLMRGYTGAPKFVRHVPNSNVSASVTPAVVSCTTSIPTPTVSNLTVIQRISNIGPGNGGWSSTFTAGVKQGNTVFMAVTDYGSGSGVAISSSTPMFNGSAYPSAVKILEQCSAGTSSVYFAIWMFPNLPSGGGTTFGLTMTGGGSWPDANVGSEIWEVDGLGASPAVDKSSVLTQSGVNSDVSSGTS